jgi:chromatin structure-remodeling complex subunit RSC9
MVTNAASATLASYEPSQAYPLSLKPVITPANNPEYYRNERKRKLEASAGPLAKKYKNIMLPGTGFIGPNIYVRAQLALQSGIMEEEQYALHHLVKISHERGEKFRFDQFPGLADALVKKILSVTSLFYDIDWDVMYDEEFFAGDDETLNGLDGTPDIVPRLKSRIPVVFDDTILDSAFLSRLNRMTEAALITRNMCLQEENALYMSRLPLVQDLIAVVLHMPDHASIMELRQYVLDIAEQVLKYIDVGTQDALYQGLLHQISGPDRGAIVTALKTISRIAMTHQAPKRLDDIPIRVLKRAQDLLLVEDEELRSACLDFFMQYTSFSDNVENLLKSLDTEALGRQLSRLVLFNAKEHSEARPSKPAEIDNSMPPPVPRLSRSLVEGLLKMEEPERSSEWLRMCFVADPNAEMTQISLWQAYQGTFALYQGTHPHLVAGDFIKNVSTTFQGATAQVAGSNKYVIRGIKSRKVPVGSALLPGAKASDKGKDLHRCHWEMTVTVDAVRDPMTGILSAPSTREQECAEWFRTSDEMLKHILNNHLQLPRKAEKPADADRIDVDTIPPSATPSSNLSNGVNGANGHTLKDNLDFQAAEKTTYKCRWAECQRSSSDFPSGKVPRTMLFARHIETHLPETEPSRSKHNLTTEEASKPTEGAIFRLTVLEDERGDAAGVPLRAALVLRNIAKFMPKRDVDAKDAAKKTKEQDAKWPEDVLFSSEVRERLFYAMSYSKTLRDYMGTIFRALKQSGGKAA